MQLHDHSDPRQLWRLTAKTCKPDAGKTMHLLHAQLKNYWKTKFKNWRSAFLFDTCFGVEYLFTQKIF
jgi:hypothetical protein